MRIKEIIIVVLCFFIFSGCQPKSATNQPPLTTNKPLELVTVTPPEGIEYYTMKGTPGQYIKDGNITIYTVSDPKTFNAYLSRETSSSMPISYMFEGLLSRDPDTLELIPALAKEWTVSKDGLVFIFKLRKAKWSDGQPITADDVLFTFNDVIFNPDIPNSTRDFLTIKGKQVKVEKIDDYTVQFTFPEVFSLAIEGISGTILPKHILEKSVKEKKFSSTWGVSTPPSQIVVNGPYKLVEYVSGQRMVMERNPYYWKKDEKGQQLPYLFKVSWLIVPDNNTAMLKFRAGELDYVGVSSSDIASFKSAEKRLDFTLYKGGPSFGTSFFSFNQNPGKNEKGKLYVDPVKLRWFTNKKFRQAIAHAIDRRSFIRLVHNETAVYLNSPIPVPNKLFYVETKVYDYDLEKARQFLREAGFYWKNNVLYDDKGNKVEFTLFTNVESTGWVQYCVLIASDLRKLGINVHTSFLQFNALVQRRTVTYDWEASIGGFSSGIEPAFGKNVWCSYGIQHLWHPKQPKPATQWETEIDKIFEDSLATYDVNQRKLLFKRFQEIIMEELPIIPLTTTIATIALKNKFGNIKPNPIGEATGRRSPLLYNIEQIYLIK